MDTPSNFHLNMNTGVLGRCRTTPDRCPVARDAAPGAVQHFTSVEEAKGAYGEHRKGDSLPAGRRRAARPTKAPKNVWEAPAPPALTRRQAQEVPVPQVEEVPFMVMETEGRRTLEGLIAAGRLPEAQAQEALASSLGTYFAGKIITQDSQASTALLASAARVLESPHFGPEEVRTLSPQRAKDLAPHLPPHHLYTMARHSTDPQVHAVLLATRENPEVPEDDAVGIPLMLNSSVSPAVKAILAQETPVLESLERISRAEKSLSGGLRELKSSKGAHNTYRTKQVSYRFSPEKIAEVGLKPQDIHPLVVHVWGERLFGASYDPSSGIYSGFRD